MTDISKHPLLKQCYELCLAIEELPASEMQTAAVVKASELMEAIDAATALSEKEGDQK